MRPEISAGPWHLAIRAAHTSEPGRASSVFFECDEDYRDKEICDFAGCVDLSDEELAANANAIAAVPELVDVVAATIEYLSKRADRESNELWSKAAAAYGKALGINT